MSSIISILDSLVAVPSTTLDFGSGIIAEYRSYYVAAIPGTGNSEHLFNFPDNLVELWRNASRLSIYEDVSYGQWGLILHDQSWSQQETKLYKNLYPDKISEYDLIFGEFLGDNEKVIISLKPADYGSIKIFQPIENREDWPLVASSMTEFLQNMLQNRGQKYWS